MNPVQKPLTMKDFRAEIAWRRRMRLPTKIFHSLIRGDREVVRHGARWRLDYGAYPGGSIIYRSYIEPASVEHIFFEAARRGCGIFLDIGAHVGFYSVIGARMGIFKEIHAFEPTPESFSRLQWHIRANGFDDLIQSHQVAASDRARKVSMLVNRSSGRNRVQELVAESLKTVPGDGCIAQAVALDSLFAFEGKRLAIKMDIEGHEVSALSGCKNLFAKNYVFLQVEVWKQNAAVVNYLLANGFRMLTHRDNDNFYFDNDSGAANR